MPWPLSGPRPHSFPQGMNALCCRFLYHSYRPKSPPPAAPASSSACRPGVRSQNSGWLSSVLCTCLPTLTPRVANLKPQWPRGCQLPLDWLSAKANWLSSGFPFWTWLLCPNVLPASCMPPILQAYCWSPTYAHNAPCCAELEQQHSKLCLT